MTLQVGDKVVTIPLRDGGRVTVRSGTISVGDKAVLVPGANGQIYAVRPASPQVGDKVILYPLRNGGHVCLASADDEGGSSPSVMPPGNFDAARTGPSTADLDWLPGEGNTAVRIVRRPDRYPVHINDGTVAYEGAGREATDTGLGFRNSYYYCAWGKAGSKYSNGYLMDRVWPWGVAHSVLDFTDDSDWQTPAVRWFNGGDYLPAGTYHLTATGWYSYWNENVPDVYGCGYDGTNKGRNYAYCGGMPQVRITYQAGGTTNLSVAGVCTYKNPGDMTGSGAITITRAAKIGIWLSDGTDHEDNMGNGSYTLV